MPSPSSLLRLAAKESYGPSPSFTRAHIFLAFLAIGDASIIGRAALAKETGVGEGAVRTILKKLVESGYVETIASGCRLTTLGRKVYTEIRRVLTQVALLDASSLSVGRVQATIKVKSSARKLGNGIEQRDAAILVGASGATTYVMKGGKFTIPGSSTNCERDFPSKAWKVLREELQPREGDSIVLCGADDDLRAKVGAVSAALTLL